MDAKLIIPKKVKVGFQERKDTYTGKLGFIIYYDPKGKLRQERSWNSWRDKSIEALEIENEPTTGFVLNKKVGDYSSRWGGRRAWIRVHDPRGFEFEISVENLLFILEYTSAIHGKGLEGEFVLAWGGYHNQSKVILLPTNCPDYLESVSYASLQTKKVTKADMVEGATYLTKDNDEVIYLGRHNYFRRASWHSSAGYLFTAKKLHIFVNTATGHYWIQKGFTKLAKKLSDSSPQFAEEYEKFKASKAGSPVVSLSWKSEFPDLSRYYYETCAYQNRPEGYYKVSLKPDVSSYSSQGGVRRWTMRVAEAPVQINETGEVLWPKNLKFKNVGSFTQDQLRTKKLGTLWATNAAGDEFQIS